MTKTTRTLILLAALTMLFPATASTAVTTEKAEKKAEAAAPAASPQPHQYSSQAPLLQGMPITATVVAAGSESGGAQQAISSALSRATTFDRELFGENGIEAQLASLQPGQQLTLPPDVFAFFRKVVDLATLTGGWFDVAGPSNKGLFTQRDWRRIHLDDKESAISFKSTGMQLDLKRAALGYEVDLALDQLIKEGFVNAMVTAGPVSRNVGRDIFTPWQIEIGFGSNPDQDANAYRANRYRISNVAAATVTPQGLGTGLIDPRNKKPVANAAMRSITIIAADATTATAYALAAYTVGPKFGLQFVEAHPETRGIMVDGNGNLLASRGFTIVTAPQDEQTAEQAAAATGGSNDLRQKQNEEKLDQ